MYSTKGAIAPKTQINVFNVRSHRKLIQVSAALMSGLLNILKFVPGRKKLGFFRIGPNIQTAYFAALVTLPPNTLSEKKAQELARENEGNYLRVSCFIARAIYLCNLFEF